MLKKYEIYSKTGEIVTEIIADESWVDCNQGVITFVSNGVRVAAFNFKEISGYKKIGDLTISKGQYDVLQEQGVW